MVEYSGIVKGTKLIKFDKLEYVIISVRYKGIKSIIMIIIFLSNINLLKDIK